jgi:crotonobetainyl-CoA:carnitine CoA-transferase CaiB-like acyl-CoA transferase
VLVYNIRPQAMKKLGLDHASLERSHPRLIHCGAYGYSEDGPYGGMPAYDDIMQARSGLAHFQGLAAGTGEPAYAATILADKTVGLTLAYAVMAALYARERTGRGQRVEVPMFETMVSFALVEHLAGRSFDPPVGPAGYERVLAPHRRPYRTRDGFIAALPYTTAQWTRFFELAGRPELARDPRFAEPGARSRNIAELYRLLAELLEQRTTDEWHALLTEADIPVSRIMTAEDLLADPHLEAVGFWQRRAHPTEGDLVGAGIPTRFSDTPPSVRRLAPGHGEHSEEVLAELGLAPEERAALFATGACRTP